ncbi:hypothetical protein MSUIS_02750 [Mycoplasma suis KI3806]|uniref:Uncharacterized protein n=1 Tax=Mycoplasma suis (strain KI_3806) TaxID=708248 RepID=F0V3E6_MYCS3|nr:hypothetical protein [Mycoplasma suis]CBZ40368.1 hypothetical protein MSUIS_02750 [Mycoplasma suis KI3806]
MRKDSWKYKKGDQGNSQLNLLGEFAQEVEESNKNSSEWKQLVKDMKPENQEEGQNSEPSNPLDGLSGTATFYIDKIDCKNIGFNFSFLDEETQKVFKLTDDKIPAKMFPSQQGGLAYWSCHESLETLE